MSAYWGKYAGNHLTKTSTLILNVLLTCIKPLFRVYEGAATEETIFKQQDLISADTSNLIAIILQRWHIKLNLRFR